MANKWKETIEKWGLKGNPFTPLPPEIDNEEKLKKIFTGRGDEIGHICGLLDPPRGFFIYGMFGVGKTILIQEAFRKLKHQDIITLYTIFDPHDGFLKTILKGLAKALANRGVEDAKWVVDLLTRGKKIVAEEKQKGKKGGIDVKIISGSIEAIDKYIETTTLEIDNPRDSIETLIRRVKKDGKTIVIAVDDLERRGDIVTMQQIIDESRDILSFGCSLILTGHPIGVTRSLRTSSGGMLVEIPLEQLPKEELIEMMIKYLDTVRKTDRGFQREYPFDSEAVGWIAEQMTKNNLTPRIFNLACFHIFEKAAIEGYEEINMGFLNRHWSIVAQKLLENIEDKDKEYIEVIYRLGGISEDSEEAIMQIGGELAEYPEVRNILANLIRTDVLIEREEERKKVIELNPLIKEKTYLFLD
jgi:hypothetical protein